MMVEWRLEWESKSTEKVQYIGNGRIETETGTWKWKRSVGGLKQNNKNWNVIRGLRDQSGVLEDNDIMLEFSGVGQGLGEW